MINKCKKILVVLISLFLCISSFYASSDNLSIPKDAIINPNYIAYEKLNDSEKSKISVVPIKYLFEYKDSNSNSIFKSVSSVRNTVSAYPSTYNLTNVGGVRYVPAVKNQGTLGLCWAFASNTTLESYFLRANKGTYNLSENQPDYVARYIGDTLNFGDGNSLYNVMKYWFLGLSPVSESDFGSYFTTMKEKTTNEFLNTDNTIIDTKEVRIYPYINVSNYVKTNFATAKSKIT